MRHSATHSRPIERITEPLKRFLHIEAASGVVLMAAAAMAIVAANTPLRDFYTNFWNLNFTLGIADWTLSYPLWYWVNDGLMTVFFFLVGLEIKREIVSGELRDIRLIASPAVAAIGGAAMPAVIFVLMMSGKPGMDGWAIPMATDIAFVVGALALLGKRIPHGLKVFLLTLAIVDDIIAVLIIAIFYSSQISLAWLIAAIAGIVVVVAMNKLGIRTVVGYLLVGSGVWFCTLKSGIHPTISGVVLGLLTPALPLISRERLRKGLAQVAGELQKEPSDADDIKVSAVVGDIDFVVRESIPPLERFETSVHPWAAFIIMPIFALANAGVPFSFSAVTSSISTAVAVALMLGNPIGIALSLFVIVKTGLGRLPKGTNWRTMIAAGSLAGIGFTMSLFVASLSLESQLLLEAKTGILIGSLLSGLIGFSALLLLLRPKTEH